MTGDDDGDHWGFAREVRGLFAPLAEEGLREVALLGCAPRGKLQDGLRHVGGRRAEAGNGWLDLLDADGARMGSYFANHVTVTAVRPSDGSGPELLDVGLRLWCGGALPGAERVWELMRTGRLDRTGMWRPLDAEGRRAWLSVALRSHGYRSGGRPDAPAGRVFTLDGRAVTDRDGFYCALGEAVNGPCGYFGWNLDALDDCLCGGFGATTPFTLEWRHSAVARGTPAARHPAVRGELTSFGPLLEILRERRVEVRLA